MPRWQSSWGQHGAHLGPVGPRWASCRPQEPCYQDDSRISSANDFFSVSIVMYKGSAHDVCFHYASPDTVHQHVCSIIYTWRPEPTIAQFSDYCWWLTPWGWVMHICVGEITIIGSDNGLSPCRHQAIIWTNTGILLIGPLVTNFSEILIGIQTFSFKKLHLKPSSAK